MIAIYLRCSTNKQETTAQRIAVEDWCKSRGYPTAEMGEYVDDAATGATANRPALQRLLTDVRAGRIRKIVTFELSRLSRSFLDILSIMQLLTAHGVEVEVPSEGVLPFASTMEQFLVAAKGLVAAQEREHVSERTKAGMRAAKARGAKLGGPTGHRYNLGRRKEHDAQLIRKVRVGSEQGLSTRAIAEMISTPERRISQSTVSRIVRRLRSAA